MGEKNNAVRMLLVPVLGEPYEVMVSSGGVCDVLGCEMIACAYDEGFGDLEAWHYIDDFGKTGGSVGLGAMRPNRAIYGRNGELVDLICGDFLIGATDAEGDSVDLPQEAILSYKERYRDAMTGLEALSRIRLKTYLGGLPVGYGAEDLRYCLAGRNLMREYMDKYHGEGRYSSYDNALERWLDYWLDHWMDVPCHTEDLHELCFDNEELSKLSDTLVSMWCPLKMALQLSEHSPWFGERGVRGLPVKTAEALEDIKAHLEEYLPRAENQKLYRLAELVELDYNVWTLPSPEMQGRGGQVYDQVAPSIALLFPGGSYAHLMETEDSVYDYIRAEGVGCLFQGEYGLVNLTPVVSGAKPGQASWASSGAELDELLSGMIDFLEKRAQVFNFAELLYETIAEGIYESVGR